MKRFIKNVSSSATAWPRDDPSKSTSRLPKIIVTTASLDHLDSVEKKIPVYLRPLDVGATKATPTLDCEISSVSDEDGKSSQNNVKNLQYEWVGEPLEHQPAPDGGWAWFVLIGTFFMTCTLASLAPCFGVLFNDPMRAMGVSSTNIAWIFNTNMFSWNLVSIISGPLIKHFGWRAVGCTASFLLATGFILIAFSWSPLYIFFMFGVLIGSMCGICIMTCILILPSYFNKRRGMANAVFSVGISIGYIIFPVLLRYLQDEFGFLGATMIHGAILLNCCVACALFRPLKKPQTHQKSTKNIIPENEKFDPLLTVNSESNPTAEKNKPRSSAIRDLFSDILKITLNNLKGVKHKPLLLTTTSIAVFLTCVLNFVSILPFALRYHGYSAREASYVVSMTGVGNLFTRLVVSCIADAKWVNRKYIYLLGLVLTSFCSFLTPVVMSDYIYLMGVVTVWGVGTALSSSIYLVMLIDVIGLSFFESGTSIIALLLALASVSTGPFVGYIRDTTSSYTWSLMTLATLQLMSALLWVFMPCVQRMHDRRLLQSSSRALDRRSRSITSARRDTYPLRRYPGYSKHGQMPLRRSTYPVRPSPRSPVRNSRPFWRHTPIPRADSSPGRTASPTPDTVHMSVPRRLQPDSEKVLLNVHSESPSLSNPSSSAQ